MGPLPPLRMKEFHDMLEITVRRQLGNGTNPATIVDDYTTRQQYIMQVLAVTFSAVSVSSAILSFYWFRRMRRSFRHDLIMFLIQSDMFKALWFMVYPIVVFTHGPVSSTSTFCQVNGFFISLGIEASDFAILMIAVHSALYIFKPRSAPGEGGLYPYRKIAFALWIFLPLLSASLAFINGRHAYVTQTTYCYLPVRPFWYRLALAWIPRYMIFSVILVIYATIYLYVRYKFRGFSGHDDRDDRMPSQDSEEVVQRPIKKFDLPPTPPLARHGLIPGSTDDSIMSQSRKQSKSTIASDSALPKAILSRVAPWSWTTKKLARPASENPLRRPSETEPPLHARSSAPEMNVEAQASTENSTRRTTKTALHIPSKSQMTSFKSVRSMMGLISFLTKYPHHPDSDSVPSTPLSQLELVNSRGENIAENEMSKQRDKIRRQLRFLFIYPLVYIGMWALPFVGHVMQYSDRYALDPPFALNAIINIVVTSQCAVDCWLFSTREKPWRHIQGTKGGFWDSLAFWRNWERVRRDKGPKGPGKSRAEMDADARAAYRRRDEENAARRGAGEASPTDARGERSWWDIEDRVNFDGSMSPVIEERNPMDTQTRAHTPVSAMSERDIVEEK